MAKAKPLSAFHRQAVQNIMNNPSSLAEITKEVGIKSVVEYMPSRQDTGTVRATITGS